MVMSKINKVLVVMKKYHDSGVFYKCVGISLGGLSECEENVGQLPSLSLIPQFSTLLYKNWKFTWRVSDCFL